MPRRAGEENLVESDKTDDQHLFKNFSEVKNKVKHSDLDALDDIDPLTGQDMPF